MGPLYPCSVQGKVNDGIRYISKKQKLTFKLTSTRITLSLIELPSLLPIEERRARMLARSCWIGKLSTASSISMSNWLYGIAIICKEFGSSSDFGFYHPKRDQDQNNISWNLYFQASYKLDMCINSEHSKHFLWKRKKRLTRRWSS